MWYLLLSLLVRRVSYKSDDGTLRFSTNIASRCDATPCLRVFERRAAKGHIASAFVFASRFRWRIELSIPPLVAITSRAGGPYRVFECAIWLPLRVLNASLASIARQAFE